jgi:DNA modification methylase
MGSQSSRIACYEMGFDYVGCEIDKDYFDAGCKRFDERCLGEYNTLNGEKWIEQSLF